MNLFPLTASGKSHGYVSRQGEDLSYKKIVSEKNIFSQNEGLAFNNSYAVQPLFLLIAVKYPLTRAIITKCFHIIENFLEKFRAVPCKELIVYVRMTEVKDRP